MRQDAEGYFELRANDYPVKALNTEYAHFCFGLANLTAMANSEGTALHAISFAPIVDQDAVEHVHHFTLFASYLPNDDIVSQS